VKDFDIEEFYTKKFRTLKYQSDERVMKPF
jgi:hypothetical protein